LLQKFSLLEFLERQIPDLPPAAAGCAICDGVLSVHGLIVNENRGTYRHACHRILSLFSCAQPSLNGTMK